MKPPEREEEEERKREEKALIYRSDAGERTKSIGKSNSRLKGKRDDIISREDRICSVNAYM